MPGIKRTFITNLLGKGLPPLLLFLLAPFYIQHYGATAWGEISLFSLLTTLASLFDFGIGPAIGREIAKAKDLSLVPTIEVLYWTIGLLIGLSLFFFTKGILSLAGLNVIANWPFAFYFAVASGLQRQYAFNLLRIATCLSLFTTTLILLFAFDISLDHLLLIQITLSFVQTGLAALMTSTGKKRTYSWQHVKKIKTFSFEMALLMIVGILIMNSDKIILSSLLSVEAFGAYNVAFLLASSLYFLISPLYTTLYPRFCALSRLKDPKLLAFAAYHFFLLLLLPAFLILFFFAPDLLFLWTKKEEKAEIVTLLAMGNFLNGLSNVSALVMNALGKLKLQLFLSLALLIALSPLSYWGAKYYGAISPALFWLIFNLIFFSCLYCATKAKIPLRTLSWCGIVGIEAWLLRGLFPQTLGLYSLFCIWLFLQMSLLYLMKNELRVSFAHTRHLFASPPQTAWAAGDNKADHLT